MRHVAPLLGALCAAFSAHATPTLPTGGLFINSASYAAYNYTNEPFQCVQPTINLQVNATHVWMIVTSYSQSAADVKTPNSPTGRTQFAFSTFLSSVAYPVQSYWDPVAQNPTLSNMFTSVRGTPVPASGTNGDFYLNMGSCDMGSNYPGSPIANYGSVTDLTVAPNVSTSSPQTTATLNRTVFSALGCTCPTYTIQADGTIVDLTMLSTPNADGTYPCPASTDNAASNHVFYSHSGNAFNGRAPAAQANLTPREQGMTQASTTNSWSYRTTTCGASSTDQCTTANGNTYFTGMGVSYANNPVTSTFGGSMTGTATCSIKTEALIIMPVQQFIVVLQDDQSALQVTSKGSSTLSYSWQQYIVEYASTKPTGTGLPGVDMFNTRVTPAGFQLNVFPAGAVVQVLAVGDVAPPMLIHTTATGNTGPVAFAQRVNASTIKMTWQFDAFVQQSTNTSNPTRPDTLLKSNGTDGMRTSGMSPSLIFAPTTPSARYAAGYSSVCDPYLITQNEMYDQTALSQTASSVITSGYGCMSANCVPQSQTTLPGDLLSGLTSAALATSIYWVGYQFTVECLITAVNSTYTVDQPFNLPTTTIKIQYRLQDASGNELTDMASPPFSEIIQIGYTAPGILSSNVTFPLQARMIQLNETTISTAADLSQLVYQTENSAALPHQLAYSEAMAVKVQIVDSPLQNNIMCTDGTTPASGQTCAANVAPPAPTIGNLRSAWQVQPVLMLMVAHDPTAGASGALTSSQYVVNGTDTATSFSTIPASWCGLNYDNVVAAWAVVDTRASGESMTGAFLAGYNFTSVGQTVSLNKLGPAFNNVVNSLSPALLTTITSLLQNNNFTDVTNLQFDIMNGNTNANSAYSLVSNGTTNLRPVAIVPDATGGFAFPLRNRFFINGKPSGYQLSFCAITQAMPYLPIAIGTCATKPGCNAFYPAYSTYSAALADTLAVGGTVHPPVVLTPKVVSDATIKTTLVEYYIPFYPASTGGTVCIPGYLTSALTASFPSATVVDPGSNDKCYNLIGTAIAQSQSIVSGRRHMLEDASVPQVHRRLLAAKAAQKNIFPTIATAFALPTNIGSVVPSLATSPELQTLIMPQTFAQTAAPPTPPSPPVPPPSPPSPPPPSPAPPLPIVQINNDQANIISKDAAVNSDTNKKVSDVPGMAILYVCIAALIVTVVFFVCWFVNCMRTRNEAPSGTTEKALGYRSVGGAGPARMQWRAY